jgi:FlaG/FlaF family flagellin (archaellin)
MRTRTLLVAALVTLAGATTACTGDEPPSSSAATSTEPTGSPIETPDYTPKEFVPGEYEIVTSGIDAKLSLDDGAGTMTVENGSTADLGEATIVLVLQTQDEVTATVEGPSSVRIGESAEYTVQLPEGVTIEDVGLFRLAFDGVNLAAFGQVVSES